MVVITIFLLVETKCNCLSSQTKGKFLVTIMFNNKHGYYMLCILPSLLFCMKAIEIV